MTTKLISPDLERCQAEKPNGVNPFTLGGRFKWTRCVNKPLFIVTEKKPGKDGLIGSMSLCDHCLAVFNKQMPNKRVVITTIEEKVKR